MGIGRVATSAITAADPAELGRLTPAVESLLPAIEEFWRYAAGDDAAGRRPDWLSRLDVPLAEHGKGLDAVLRDLAEVVVPNGSRIGEPGWSGFITTGPTTSAVAAWLAAATAGSQRYLVQAFNTLERVALDWVADLCRIPADFQGVLSSGGFCFRYRADDTVNLEILRRLRRGTRSIPTSTMVGGRLAIRPCFINPRTELADVDALTDHVIAIGDELTA